MAILDHLISAATGVINQIGDMFSFFLSLTQIDTSLNAHLHALPGASGYRGQGKGGNGCTHGRLNEDPLPATSWYVGRQGGWDLGGFNAHCTLVCLVGGVSVLHGAQAETAVTHQVRQPAPVSFSRCELPSRSGASCKHPPPPPKPRQNWWTKA